uniref:Enoyl-[acyl-carrier-protein] reductase, mitochondrial n=1 Tax=Hirondellea gigas TaxID=1518452 RepID=A0A2P2HWQ7_9CRUS
MNSLTPLSSKLTSCQSMSRLRQLQACSIHSNVVKHNYGPATPQTMTGSLAANLMGHQNTTGVAARRMLSTSNKLSVTCQQLIMEEYGEPEKVVKMQSVELPSLKPGEVLIKMIATTINPSDINTIQGMYAVKPDLPCILGNEGVAEVIEVSSEGEKGPLQVGDWVIPVMNAYGTWRSHAIGTHDEFTKLPKGMDAAAAATLSVNPTTAYRMLKDFVKLEKGDLVIQNAGNSGVGRAVIQLCAHYGYKSINVVRDRPAIAELKKELMDMGATMVLTERELRVSRELRAMEKPPLALNCVSGKSATELIRLMRDGGVMVTYGGMARQPVTVPVGSLIFSDVRLVGYWQTRWSLNPANQEAKKEMLSDLCEFFKKGTMVVPPHKMVPHTDYMKALADAMPADGQVGCKQILTFN